jgi:hypothetical protein
VQFRVKHRRSVIVKHVYKNAKLKAFYLDLFKLRDDNFLQIPFVSLIVVEKGPSSLSKLFYLCISEYC